MTKWLLFPQKWYLRWSLKDRAFWRHTGVREGIPGRSNHKVKGTKVEVWVVVTGEVKWLGGYDWRFYHPQELRLYHSGIKKPLEVGGMPVNFALSVRPCLPVVCSRVSCKAKDVVDHLRRSAIKADCLLKSCLQSQRKWCRSLYFRSNPSLLYYDFWRYQNGLT